LLTIGAFALSASDNSTNYGGGWTTDSNGGTGFNPWGFLPDPAPTGAIYEIADSTVGAGDVNQSGGAFRMAATEGGSIEAIRSFGGGASLGAGDVFTFDLTVNFRNGNKGFDLRNGGTTVFNFNVGSDNYFFGGTDLGAEGWGYVDDGIYSFEFGFVSETIVDAKITRVSVSDTTSPRVFELQDLVLSAPVDNFKFYVSETDNNTALEENSLYFNNLNVVPEPSAFAFLTGLLVLSLAVRRR
jgi:hypothetical protein